MKGFRITIGMKLVLGFLVMFSCVGLLGLASYYGMQGIHENLKSIFRVNYPAMDFLVEADRDLQQLLVAERSMAYAKPGTDVLERLKKEYADNLKQSDERWGKYKALAASPQEKALIPNYERAREEWKPLSAKVTVLAVSSGEADRQAAIDLSLTEASKAFEKMRGVINELTDLNLKLAQEEERQADAAYGRSLVIFGSIAGFALLASILFIVATRRTITRPIFSVMDGLSAGAERVASVSSEVFMASRTLAEGASEQAAAVEETSSSLEEMSSMTRQNARNAEAADQLLKEANQGVGQANRSMSELTVAMVEISKASEETQKIIKTIDEIAFQTNLLALNAAVEAARAGEAGAGFAVVADEVRNLAMRAAEAARNTAGMIEGTVKRIKEGAELVGRTERDFLSVAGTVEKSGELVGGIAAASEQQSLGVEQISRAMAAMDKVIQHNSAGAEETAAASREMNALAEHLQACVAALVGLVEGRVRQGSERMAERQRTVQVSTRQPSGKRIGRSEPKPVEPGRRLSHESMELEDF